MAPEEHRAHVSIAVGALRKSKALRRPGSESSYRPRRAADGRPQDAVSSAFTRRRNFRPGRSGRLCRHASSCSSSASNRRIRSRSMLRSSAAGRAWRRPRSAAPFRRPSLENPGRAPGRRPLPFALDVSFVGRHANRDDAHEDGTDANDGFRAGNPAGEATRAIFGHNSVPGAVQGSLNL